MLDYKDDSIVPKTMARLHRINELPIIEATVNSGDILLILVKYPNHSKIELPELVCNASCIGVPKITIDSTNGSLSLMHGSLEILLYVVFVKFDSIVRSKKCNCR